ncbi:MULTISPECIES: DUF7673 family protein [Rhodanobacter]|uniref:DUF7673 family protein n=1 Tax=Rhodanobacter TaxID=75309 RepID=UPI0002E46BBD|nr:MULTISPECIES: hypothetical protein [Rhodanobacter]KZC21399.1 hypothetical protein RHOFW104R3_02155 [Rhodanobacter denitrificans]UJM90521.1 hypothetical protein LRK24_01040 [Rhodanobacter denitrificans]UJM94052.1 hypothetical protein LRK32_01030 [Rhodanobacter denitrificans]UJM97581.1 hypothetical protein LRK44_01030 [Rhodanobacter denitrificans]UJN23003.1 hypothetical protein LRK54_07460 [Rhodanobacter denitrificans]
MALPDLSVTICAPAEHDPTQPTPEELAAMHHLAEVALGNSGQASRCANFLLAWADADSFGAYDPTDIWACDPTVIRDTVTVFGLIARVSECPELLDPTIRDELAAIATKWRR